MLSSTTKSKPGIFYGWWIVLAVSVLFFWSGGIWFYGFSAFFTPIVAEFGWSRALTSAAFSLYRLEAGIIAPLIGYLVDRVGVRRLMIIGVVAVGAGFILLSGTGSVGWLNDVVDPLWQFYAAFIVIAIGYGLAFFIPGMTAVANWFARRRGRAMAFTVAGFGASGVLVPLLVWLIDTSGWRTTLLIVGVMTWVIGIPFALVVRHRPEPYGYQPDGDPLPASEERGRTGTVSVTVADLDEDQSYADAGGFTAKEALRTPAFWYLSTGVALSTLGISGIIIHAIPYLESVGISRQVAGLAITGMSVGSVGGRVIGGWLADYFDKRWVLAMAYAALIGGTLVFAAIREPWQVIPFIMLFGLAYGSPVPVRPAIQAEYFGVRAYGTIQGFMQFVMMGPGIVGPVLAGWVYDVFGDYRPAFFVFAAITAVGIPLILMARRPAGAMGRVPEGVFIE